MSLANRTIINADEIKLLFKQELYSSSVRQIEKKEFENFDDYRRSRARLYLNRCKLRMNISSSKEKQLLRNYLLKVKYKKKKLTNIDIILIEYCIGIADKSDVEEALKYETV